MPTCSSSMGMSAQGSLVNTRPSKADVIPQRQRQPRPVSTKWEKIGSHEIRPSIFLSVFCPVPLAVARDVLPIHSFILSLHLPRNQGLNRSRLSLGDADESQGPHRSNMILGICEHPQTSAITPGTESTAPVPERGPSIPSLSPLIEGHSKISPRAQVRRGRDRLC